MVVIQKRVGQLGNQLFNLAHFAAAAIAHDFHVLCPCFQYPLDQFPNLNSNTRLHVWNFSSVQANRTVHRIFKMLRVAAPRSPLHECLVADGPTLTFLDDPAFAQIARQKALVACEGFGFRAIRSITTHYCQIQQLFRPCEETISRVDGYREAKGWSRDTVVVGFHIRRSDYRDYLGGRYCYEDLAWKRWIAQARSTLCSGSSRFAGVLFSDEDTRPLLDTAGDLFTAPGNAFQDLHMLSQCNFILGPPSTFSGWASFIGRVPIMRLESASVAVTTSAFNIVTW
jgi:hypothetical protein